MFPNKLGFISRPIRGREGFLTKYGIEKMAATRKEPVKKLSRAKINSISLAGKTLSEEIVVETIFREARANFSFFFNSSTAADVDVLEASGPFRGLVKRCYDHFFDLFSERVKGSFDKHALIQVRWYEFVRQVLAGGDVEEIVTAVPLRGKEIVSCILESVLIAGFKFVRESQEASSRTVMVARESINISEDDVSLLKLGSAAALKLKQRLRQIALPLSRSKQSLKNMILKEMDALEKMEDHEKTNIPNFLYSLDEGNLLVLKMELISFLRKFTQVFGRVVNQNGYHSFGRRLFKVAEQQVMSDSGIKRKFYEAMICLGITISPSIKSDLYNRLLRKIFNIRCNGFVRAQKCLEEHHERQTQDRQVMLRNELKVAN